MRAVVQRVKGSSVTVDGSIVGQIGKGLLVFLGVSTHDTIEDASYLSEKIMTLRIFEDEEGKMNKSLLDIDGELLVVSQFTIMGDVRKGRRPSFSQAAPPDMAMELYEAFTQLCRTKVKKVETGKFQAEMLVNISNDGPVTILLDSKKLF